MNDGNALNKEIKDMDLVGLINQRRNTAYEMSYIDLDSDIDRPLKAYTDNFQAFIDEDGTVNGVAPDIIKYMKQNSIGSLYVERNELFNVYKTFMCWDRMLTKFEWLLNSIHTIVVLPDYIAGHLNECQINVLKSLKSKGLYRGVIPND